MTRNSVLLMIGLVITSFCFGAGTQWKPEIPDRVIEIVKEVYIEVPVEIIKEVPVEVLVEVLVEKERIVYVEIPPDIKPEGANISAQEALTQLRKMRYIHQDYVDRPEFCNNWTGSVESHKKYIKIYNDIIDLIESLIY